jgi:hypothetical protein
MLRRLAIVAVLLSWISPLAAQGLRSQVSELFHFGACDTLICLDLGLPNFHGRHFIPSAQSTGGTLITFLGAVIGNSVANTPISTAASGTTFRFEGGVPVKSSTSAGPIFAERAQTLGRGRWFFGAGFTQQSYVRLRGVSLNDLSFTFTHVDVKATGVPGPDTLGLPTFENDVITVDVAMQVTVMVASLSVTYGLIDGVDLGVSVPFVRTAVSGSSVAQIVPGTDSFPVVHRFGGTATDPEMTATSSISGSAAGIGDVAVRLKINVAQTDRLGVALLGDFRLPTGDAENLLGAGRFSGRGLAIASAQFGAFNPHVNFGVTVRDAPQQNNSIEANAGYDLLLAPRATLVFDVLTSWQVGASHLPIPQTQHYDYPVARDISITNIPAQHDNYAGLSTGFKVSTKGGVQVVTSALFPLTHAGLQPVVIWTGGLEYSF